MHVKVERVSQGLHPSEVVVGITTSEGVERLVVREKSIVNDHIDVGFPINEKGGAFLVELPRETQTGSWRVWVPKEFVVEAA